MESQIGDQTTTKENEISREFKRLDISQEELQKTIERLEKILTPILRPATPKLENSEEKPVSTDLNTTFGRALKTNFRSIVDSTEAIKLIIKRIEL